LRRRGFCRLVHIRGEVGGVLNQWHGNGPDAVLAGMGPVLDRLGRWAVGATRFSVGRAHVDTAGRGRLHHGARSPRTLAARARQNAAGRIVFEKRGVRGHCLRPMARLDLAVLWLADSANAIGQGASSDNESCWPAPHHGTAPAGASRSYLCAGVLSVSVEQPSLDWLVFSLSRSLRVHILAVAIA